ncbi:hypothetical protein MMX123_02493 [Microbacterium sp. MM2322]
MASGSPGVAGAHGLVESAADRAGPRTPALMSGPRDTAHHMWPLLATPDSMSEVRGVLDASPRNEAP